MRLCGNAADWATQGNLSYSEELPEQMFTWKLELNSAGERVIIPNLWGATWLISLIPYSAYHQLKIAHPGMAPICPAKTYTIVRSRWKTVSFFFPFASIYPNHLYARNRSTHLPGGVRRGNLWYQVSPRERLFTVQLVPDHKCRTIS